jgi:hypothetical protein
LTNALIVEVILSGRGATRIGRGAGRIIARRSGGRMSPRRKERDVPILKLSDHDDPRELEFELDYLLRLTLEERFALMRERSEEMARALIRHGHRRPAEIVKRPRS